MAVFLPNRKMQDISDDEVWAHVWGTTPGVSFTDAECTAARKILEREWHRSGMAQLARVPSRHQHELDAALDAMVDSEMGTRQGQEFQGRNR